MVDKGTIILKKIVDLAAELGVAADSNVLGHLEGDNLVELGARRDFAVIAAENASLISRDLSKGVSNQASAEWAVREEV